MQLKIEKASLILIILVAMLLRFIGTNPGYNNFHSDENFIYGNAVEMVKSGSIEPFRYDYPALIPIIHAVLYQEIFIPTSLANYYLSNIEKVLDGTIHIPPVVDEFKGILQDKVFGSRDINAIFWSRYITAFFGTLSVVLSFLITKKISNTKGGLIAAFFIAINYRQVLNSHFGLPDIYNAFFLLLAYYHALKLREKRSFSNYLIGGLICGLSLAAKYQYFCFIPYVAILIENFIGNITKKEKKKIVIDFKFLMIPLIAIIIFLLINPYFFVNINLAVSQLKYVALKYRAGRNQLDFYPISYLYRIGIGRFTSWLIIVGILFSFFKKRRETIYLLLVIIPFLLTLIYFTGGGFYTRNFITITPFLLIFVGVLYSQLWSSRKLIIIILSIFILVPTSIENISNDLIVLKEYTKPWNYKIIGSWISNNIPQDALVAAHSSVPVPDNIKKINFDLTEDFNLDEFRAKKAGYAIANLDWTSVDFYSWMTQDTKTSLSYWNKPVATLENTFTGLSMKEFLDFGVYSVQNAWQAPDSDFIVAKVPYYSITKKELYKDFNFSNKPQSISTVAWESPIIDISTWEGFDFEYLVKTTSSDLKGMDGYIVASFYNSKDDIHENRNRKVRLSKRNPVTQNFMSRQLAGVVPSGSKFMVLSLNVYNPAKYIFDLKDLAIYKANVFENLDGVKVSTIKVDESDLYPNSHGNL